MRFNSSFSVALTKKIIVDEDGGRTLSVNGLALKRYNKYINNCQWHLN